VRKILFAGTQVAAGLTIAALSLLEVIDKDPYTILAPLVSGGLLADGCRNLHALITAGRDNPRVP